jgi:hypothetical protein
MSAATPGIARKESFQGKPATLERPVFSQSFHPIMRAGRGVAATVWQVRRNGTLVKLYESNHEKNQQFVD